MAKRSVHEVLEKSIVPILVVILVPIGVIAYAALSANTPASTPTQQAAQEAPVQQTPSVTPATISLNDASSLPTSVTAAELVPFSFTIQNTGNASGTIPYKVYVKWSTGEEDVIDENIASLAAGASSIIQENLKFEIATETADVYLELTQSGQTSEFALPQK